MFVLICCFCLVQHRIVFQQQHLEDLEKTGPEAFQNGIDLMSFSISFKKKQNIPNPWDDFGIFSYILG